jgi:undecaprenyl-diphosphatase
MKNRRLLIFVIISTLILVLLVWFIDTASISSFDTWFYNETAKKMTPELTLTMRFITESGSSMAVIILCLSFFLFKKTRRQWALPVSITVVATTISNVFLKLLFARERPNIMQLIEEDSYSFPSGHAMINISFYTIILLLTWHYIKNKRIKYSISLVCLIMPLLIGFSRIYLGVHYATDVLAGWLLGFIIALIVYNIFKQKSVEV